MVRVQQTWIDIGFLNRIISVPSIKTNTFLISLLQNDKWVKILKYFINFCHYLKILKGQKDRNKCVQKTQGANKVLKKNIFGHWGSVD